MKNKIIKHISDFTIGTSKIYLIKRTRIMNRYYGGSYMLRTIEFRFLSFYRELRFIEENI